MATNQKPGPINTQVQTVKLERETDITDRTLTRFLVDAPVEPVDGNGLVYSYAPELEADTVGPES